MELRKRGDVWHYDFSVAEKRYRGTTKQTDKKLAKEVAEAKYHEALAAVRAFFRGDSISPEQDTKVLLIEAAEWTQKEHYGPGKHGQNMAHVQAKLIRILGNIDITTIDEDQYEQVKDYLIKEGRARETVNHYLKALNVILKNAAKRHKVKCHRGIQGALMPKPRNVLNRVIDDYEERKVREWFRTYPYRQRTGWSNVDLVEIFDMAMLTGMRRGEIFTITVNQIEADKMRIFFGADQHKTGEHTGIKYVDLNEDAMKIVQDRISRYGYTGQDRIFPYQMRSWTKLWLKMKTEIGVKDIKAFRFHTARHTFASRLLDQDVNIYVVKEMLGHSSITTTERYTHVSDAKRQEAVSKLKKTEK